jgi:hypothetical protein
LTPQLTVGVKAAGGDGAALLHDALGGDARVRCWRQWWQQSSGRSGSGHHGCKRAAPSGSMHLLLLLILMARATFQCYIYVSLVLNGCSYGGLHRGRGWSKLECVAFQTSVKSNQSDCTLKTISFVWFNNNNNNAS